MAKAMKLIDEYTGLMQCKFCGWTHWAMLKHGGGYVRGSWQCGDPTCPKQRLNEQAPRAKQPRRFACPLTEQPHDPALRRNSLVDHKARSFRARVRIVDVSAIFTSRAGRTFVFVQMVLAEERGMCDVFG